MSTEPTLPRLADIDNPWRRLAWTLPAAVLIWIAVLWAFAVFTRQPRQRLPEPAPVDAQIVELPPPPPPPPPKEPERAPPPKPAPPPPRAVVKEPPPARRVRAPATPAPAPPAVRLQSEAPSPPAPPSPAPAPPPPPAPAPTPPSTGSDLSASSGAQAVVQPKPQIPDELREEALHAVVTARFHVAADGSATVDLVRPSPDPRLNRAVLDSLKKWRFFPATKNGQPVASVQEVTIHLDVD